LFRWEMLASEGGAARGEGPGRPRLWYLDLAAGRSARPPNYALGPLTTNRPIVSVGRGAVFRGELLSYGHQHSEKPHRLVLRIDNKKDAARVLPAPPGTGETFKNAFGRIPFSFTHRFTAPGSHLVSVELEADPPPEARPP